jgi:hypothetical protein
LMVRIESHRKASCSLSFPWYHEITSGFHQ